MNIEQLLDKLDEAQTNEEIREIGQEILAEDPQSPYGKLAVWETMEYEECVENLDTLYEALDTIRAVVDSKTEPPVIEEDRDAQVYCTIMMNLGYTLLSEGRPEDALPVAKEFANFDDEGYFPSLGHLQLNIEGNLNFKALLFIPQTAPNALFRDITEKSVQLYSSRVFIQDNCKELLPDYLKFVRGVVDTEDLPLNVSREVVQNSPVTSKIRNVLTSKLLAMLEEWK